MEQNLKRLDKAEQLIINSMQALRDMVLTRKEVIAMLAKARDLISKTYEDIENDVSEEVLLREISEREWGKGTGNEV